MFWWCFGGGCLMMWFFDSRGTRSYPQSRSLLAAEASQICLRQVSNADEFHHIPPSASCQVYLVLKALEGLGKVDKEDRGRSISLQEVPIFRGRLVARGQIETHRFEGARATRVSWVYEAETPCHQQTWVHIWDVTLVCHQKRICGGAPMFLCDLTCAQPHWWVYDRYVSNLAYVYLFIIFVVLVAFQPCSVSFIRRTKPQDNQSSV